MSSWTWQVFYVYACWNLNTEQLNSNFIILYWFSWKKPVVSFLFFLPPASEGWGKVIFSLCVSVHTLTEGGYLIPIHPHPYPSLSGGVPDQALDGGGVPRSSLGQGGYPNPSLDWGGTPTLDGGYPNLGLGGIPTLDGGVPHLQGGTPSHVWGVPWVPPGIASTYYSYVAGGVPLAFTQEDFLVSLKTAVSLLSWLVGFYHWLLQSLWCQLTCTNF